MINTALEYTRRSLNQFIQNKFAINDEVVISNRLVDPNGTVPIENQNKIVLSIVHIDQETNKAFHNRNKRLADGDYAVVPLDELYNVFFLVVPNYNNYQEALKLLNASIQFFQNHSSIDKNSYANIPKGIHKLEFEFEKGDGYMQMQNLWSALGAKYQPSVIYKMRLIAMSSDQVIGFNSSIKKTSNNVEQ